MVVCHVYHYDFKCLFSIKLKVVGYFMTIPCQRHLFSIPTDVAYLNTAYMSPLMTSVVDSINLGARLKATPWDISIPDFFKNSELARELFSRIVNVKPESVALVPSASYGMETAARNLKVGEGQTIVMLENQFPSNVYPWRWLIKKTGGKIIKVSEEDARRLAIMAAVAAARLEKQLKEDAEEVKNVRKATINDILGVTSTEKNGGGMADGGAVDVKSFRKQVEHGPKKFIKP